MFNLYVFKIFIYNYVDVEVNWYFIFRTDILEVCLCKYFILATIMSMQLCFPTTVADNILGFNAAVVSLMSLSCKVFLTCHDSNTLPNIWSYFLKNEWFLKF